MEIENNTLMNSLKEVSKLKCFFCSLFFEYLITSLSEKKSIY
jgi:hypothetical protein